MKHDLRIFISHSGKDATTVDALVELIKNALNLPDPAIRCTSRDGNRLPGGANTDDQLRAETIGVDAFVCLVSPGSVRSMYVAFELGARWGASRRIWPMLAPGVKNDILSGPLTGINALSCSESAQLHQLVSELADELGIGLQPAAAYQKYMDTLLAIDGCPDDDASNEQDDQLRPEDRIQPPTLLDVEFDVLKAVEQYSPTPVEDVAELLGISPDKAAYYLEELFSKHRLVQRIERFGAGPSVVFNLTHAGRGYLIERGVIT